MKRFFIILIVFNFSCQIIDRPEKAPSFIQIDDFQFSISNNNQGTSSEKITDAWIYLNGNLDNQFNPRTKEALIKYQKDYGLEVGQLDKATLESLGVNHN